jgi:hypothetical protein
MTNFFAILITTIFFICSGWYLSYLARKIEVIERLGLSFMLGAGTTTFIWFCLSLLGLPLNLITLLLSGLTISLLGYIATVRIRTSSTTISKAIWNHQTKIIGIIIVLLLISAFTIGNYTPLTAWDSIALYDFRGHAIALENSLGFSKLGTYFMSYPLMISLSHAVVYMLSGTSAQGLHAIIFAAFTMVIYGRLKSWTNSNYATIGALLLVTQSELFTHATFAYTNLPYTAYLILGVMYVVSEGTYSLILGGLLLGLSTWVRSAEVFWILGIILILWQGVRRKQFVSCVVAIFLVLGFKFSWSTYLSQMFAAISQTTDSNLTHFSLTTILKIRENLWEIAKYLYWNIYLPYIGMWFLVIPNVIIALVKKNTRLLMLVSTIIMSIIIVTVGVMIFSTYFETWNQIGDSAKRMMLFVIPLSIIQSVYALYIINHKHE